jgi:hypothetical protein
MQQFTKLVPGICDSSIWEEPLATRVVWITCLAKSDYSGLVACSKSGLERAANLNDHDAFEAALKSLIEDDPDSRTPDYGGRRIERVDGGYQILNYAKYRERQYSPNPDAVRQRVYRAKKIDTIPMPEVAI